MTRVAIATALLLAALFIPVHAATSAAQVQNSQLYAIWGDRNEKRLLVGGADGVLWQSTDAGDHWAQAATDGDSRIREFASNDTSVVLAIADEYLLRSDDAGAKWQRVSTPEGFVPNSARYHASTRRWIATTAKGLLASNDGGILWTISLRAPEGAPLFTLGETAQGVLLAGGAKGQLLSSRDGLRWRAIPARTGANLIHLVTAPDKQGTLAVWNDGTLALLSPDARTAWNGSTGQSDPAYAATYDAIHKQILLGTSGGAVMRSKDMGRSWQSSVVADRAYLNAVHVDLRDGSILVAGARASIARSRDGGQSWQLLHGNEWASRLNSLNASSNGNTLLAVGSGGLMMRSLDRGNTWTTLRPDLARYISDLAALPKSGAVQLIGFDGLVARSENGGENWRIADAGLKSPVSLQGMSVDAAKDRILICGPVGTLLRSEDGGRSWATQQPIADAGEGYLKQLSASGQTALALGNPGRLMRSLDGGVTWRSAGANEGESGFAYALAVDQKTLLALQADGAIQRSVDAGETWQSAASLPAAVAPTSSLHLDPADGSIWALGLAGMLARSADQGLSWQSIALPQNAHVGHMLRTENNTLLGFGDRGSILRSTDQGKSWQQTGFVNASSLRKPAIDPLTQDVWVAGRDGTLLRSRDDGQHWSLVGTHTRAHLNRVAIDTATRSLIVTGERLIRLPLEPAGR